MASIREWGTHIQRDGLTDRLYLRNLFGGAAEKTEKRFRKRLAKDPQPGEVLDRDR